jgi:hypothetical protein
MNTIIQWANENSGFLSLMIFISTLFLGWVSGIFQSLMKKPKFKLKINSGPTICTTFVTGKRYNDYDLHRTAISIYLGVSNIGSAPSSIQNVWIGYHWHIKPINWLWFRYRILWYWIKKPINTMEDFQYNFGDRIKIYPSLLQGITTTKKAPVTYLEVGKSINGVVYFEQDDSWGGCFPTSNNGKVKLRIVVIDTFGKKFKKTFWVPSVNIEEAQKYNPAFGASFAIMRGEIENESVGVKNNI